MDVTPAAVEQLNYAQCYPIVIYFKASDRRQIKQIRHEYGKLYQKSSRRLFESSERLEFLFSYLFTSVIKLDSTANWYKTLKAQIEIEQEQPIWMCDDRPADKDLPNSDEYFISTRKSYSDENYTRDESSPDSDMLNTQQRKGKNYLQRVASDPVMFPRDKMVKIIDIVFSIICIVFFLSNFSVHFPQIHIMISMMRMMMTKRMIVSLSHLFCFLYS